MKGRWGREKEEAKGFYYLKMDGGGGGGGREFRDI